MQSDRLQRAGGLVVLAHRVVAGEGERPGRPGSLRLGKPPSDLLGASGCPHVVGLPGAEAETVGPIGHLGGVDKLARQGGERLVVCADQERIGPVEDMRTVRCVAPECSRVEKGTEAFGVV
jgi:hypothetical protein